MTVETNGVFAEEQAVFVDGCRTATAQSGPYFQTEARPLVDFSTEIYLASGGFETG